MGSAKVMSCTVEPNLLQLFVMSPSGVIMTDESVCLDAPERDHTTLQPKVRIMACSGLDRQKWSYNSQVSLCLKVIHVKEDVVSL
jgi:polypeptide N-acetylgalactosaminyltransferase